jgi:hypothetical protein
LNIVLNLVQHEFTGLYQEAALVKGAESRVAAAVDEQRLDGEKQQARHLAFIDRLLMDKDALTQKCLGLAAEVQVIGVPFPSCDWRTLPLM